MYISIGNNKKNSLTKQFDIHTFDLIFILIYWTVIVVDRFMIMMHYIKEHKLSRQKT